MKEQEQTIRIDMAHFCKRIYEKNLCVGGEGNISVRINDAKILVTPTGSCLGDLKPEDFVAVTIQGRVVGCICSRAFVGNQNAP